MEIDYLSRATSEYQWTSYFMLLESVIFQENWAMHTFVEKPYWINLSGSIMGANLSNTSLSRANLSWHPYLKQTSVDRFGGADLRGADLSRKSNLSEWLLRANQVGPSEANLIKGPMPDENHNRLIHSANAHPIGRLAKLSGTGRLHQQSWKVSQHHKLTIKYHRWFFFRSCHW